MATTSSTPIQLTQLTEREQEQVASANRSGPAPVVFVHGLWLHATSWNRWADLFEGAGFATITPDWPGDPDSVAEANEHPEAFAEQTVGSAADHMEHVIHQLDRP